jgi:hypothetical protein
LCAPLSSSAAILRERERERERERCRVTPWKKADNFQDLKVAALREFHPSLSAEEAAQAMVEAEAELREQEEAEDAQPEIVIPDSQAPRFPGMSFPVLRNSRN